MNVSIESVVWFVVFVLGSGIIFGALIWLTRYVEREFPDSAPFPRFARIGLVILAVLVFIGIVLDLMGHPILRLK